MTNSNSEKIIMYGTTWCGDTIRARKVFDNNQIQYDFIDIDKNEEGRKFVETTNNGMRSVPTIVFPDDTILVEPSNMQLLDKLGLG